MASSERACVSVYRGRGSFAALTLGINYTGEGQSVGGPYTVLSLNNCLLEYMSVYGRVASPKRTNCSLGMLAISLRSCIPKRKMERGGGLEGKEEKEG